MATQTTGKRSPYDLDRMKRARFGVIFFGMGVSMTRGKHMNSAAIEFVGPDELSTVWTEIEAGKPVFVAKSRLVRKPR